MADEHLQKHGLEKSIKNFRRQKPAIVQTALNFVTDYVPGNFVCKLALLGF